MALLSETEALLHLQSLFTSSEALSTQRSVLIPLGECVGRFAAKDLWATVAIPSFDNSSMDGYALHAEDCGQTDRWLDLLGEQAAGASQGLTLTPGSAARIFTGAPVPEGTGAILMQEDAEVSPCAKKVRATEASEVGEFIRRRGADVFEGLKIIAKGTRFTPTHIGLLASQGLTQVPCMAAPLVSIVSTGDELTEPGTPLPHPSALYNSNGPMLAALAHQHGAHQAITRFTLPDDLERTIAIIGQLSDSHDFIVISGGVSVGDRDFIRPALEALGAQLNFWRVAIKPGKPFLMAQLRSTYIFGLPGNPVSSFVTWQLFVRPCLAWFQGSTQTSPHRQWIQLPTASPLTNHDIRPHYIRGQIDPHGRFSPDGLQESHALYTLSRATALALVPGQAELAAGASVSVWLI